MDQFIYILGHILYDCFTLWLAMVGALFLWDVVNSKCRKRKRPLEGWRDYTFHGAILTAFALAAGSIDFYLLSPALGAGINFFFAS